MTSLAKPLERSRSAPSHAVRAIDHFASQYREQNKELTVVQVGACNGNVPNDPLRPILERHDHVRAHLVEAVPWLAEELAQRMAPFGDRVRCHHAVISARDEPRVFFAVSERFAADHPEARPWRKFQIGSFSDRLLERHIPQAYIAPLEVSCLSPRSFLAQAGLHADDLDLLIVDTEGFDGEIVGAFLEVARPAMIVYERSVMPRPEHARLQRRLLSAGYLCQPAGEDMVCHRDAAGLDAAGLRGPGTRDALPKPARSVTDARPGIPHTHRAWQPPQLSRGGAAVSARVRAADVEGPVPPTPRKPPPRREPLLYTYREWTQWYSHNQGLYMRWDVRRCAYGDPHEAPPADATVFYTDSELEHATRHDVRRKIAWMTETKFVAPQVYDLLERMIDCFDRVLTFDQEVIERHGDKCVFYPQGGSLVQRPDFALYDKTKLVSFLSSSRAFDEPGKPLMAPGYAMRHLFYKLIERRDVGWPSFYLRDLEIDLFGPITGGPRLPYKLPTLEPYRFQVVFENNVSDTYFTEKIIDCFVTGTIPIYWGTRGVDRYFDPEGILHFRTLEELARLLARLSPEDYARRRRSVERNFHTALHFVTPEDWIFENTDVFDDL